MLSAQGWPPPSHPKSYVSAPSWRSLINSKNPVPRKARRQCSASQPLSRRKARGGGCECWLSPRHTPPQRFVRATLLFWGTLSPHTFLRKGTWEAISSSPCVSESHLLCPHVCTVICPGVTSLWKSFSFRILNIVRQIPVFLFRILQTF